MGIIGALLIIALLLWGISDDIERIADALEGKIREEDDDG